MKKIKIKNKKMNMKKRKQCKALFPKTRTLVHQISEEFYYVDLNENPNCLNQHALGKGSSDYPNDFFCENIFACSTVILERIFAIYQHAEATNFYHISRVTESSATLLLFVQCSRRKLLVCYSFTYGQFQIKETYTLHVLLWCSGELILGLCLPWFKGW